MLPGLSPFLFSANLKRRISETYQSTCNKKAEFEVILILLYLSLDVFWTRLQGSYIYPLQSLIRSRWLATSIKTGYSL
jgi:hypothetical protein